MSNTKYCLCGCGATTKGRYAPGHDAKHKGRLQRLCQSGGPSAEAAARELVELGWGSYVPGELMERIPQRNSRGERTKPLFEIDMWFIDADGMAHATRRCIGIHSFIERWTIKHPLGWNTCNECTHEKTFLEEWHEQEARRAWVRHATTEKLARRPTAPTPAAAVASSRGLNRPASVTGATRRRG